MSTQRYISTSFWDDKWIRSLDPSERYLYMYLLTNTLTTISGIYRITIDRIAYDTGYDERTLAPMIDRFRKAKKADLFEDEYIILPSWPKHQKWESKSKIRDGIISCLQDLPKRVIDRAYDLGYLFDLSLVDTTIIARKQRKDISGTTSKLVKEKYGNKCAVCSSTDNLNIHHINPVKNGGNNSIDNLILLCQECHIKEHSPHIICGKKSKSTYKPNYSDSDSDIDLDIDADSGKKSSVSKKQEAKHEYGSEKNVLLTDAQYSKLVADLGEAMALACIEELSQSKAMKGYKYKRDDLAIRKWVIDAVKKKGVPLQVIQAPKPVDSVLCPVCETNERPTVRGCCTKCGFFLDPSWINDPEIIEEQKAAWLKASANA